MVMRKTNSSTIREPRSLRRIGVADAKARLSELLRDAARGPTLIHNRGRDLAVVLAISDYDELTAEAGDTRGAGAAFLERIDALKARSPHLGEDFEPARLTLDFDDPFRRSRPPRN